MLIACGGLQEDARLVNNKNYPEIAERLRAEHQDVQDAAGRRVSRRAQLVLRPGREVQEARRARPNPYIDPAGYKAWVANMEKNYNTLLAEQKKNPPAN